MRTYYPLIDATPDGIEKIPMFPAHTISDGFGKGNFALAEIEPHSYILLAMEPHDAVKYLSYNIHCPLCGKIMTAAEPHRDQNILAVYRCENCHK